MTGNLLYNALYRERLKSCSGYSYIHLLVLFRPIAFLCLIMSFLGSGFLSGGRDYASLPSVAKIMFYGPGVFAAMFTLYIAALGLLLNAALPGYIDILKQQLVKLWRLYLLMGYLGIQCLLSDYPDVVALRLDFFWHQALPILVIIVVLFPFKDDLLAFRNASYLLGIVAIGLFVYFHRDPSTLFSTEYMDYRLAIISDPITTGCNLFLGAIAGICMLRERPAHGIRKILHWFAILMLITGACLTGSKGPIISFACAILFLLFHTPEHFKIKLIISMLCALVIATGYLLVGLNFPDSHLYITDEYRPLFYKTAISSKSLLYGNGIGSFGSLVGGVDKDVYIHNTLLEAYFEIGVTGLLLYGWVIFGCFRELLRAHFSSPHPATLFCICALIFMFVEAQFSGSLIMDKNLFPFLLYGSLLGREESHQSIQPT